jgi:hypothetical protein
MFVLLISLNMAVELGFLVMENMIIVTGADYE